MTDTLASGDIRAALARSADEVEGVLDGLLALPEGPERRVVEAMRYATLGAGKRLRPFLLLSAAELFGADRASALRAGAAVELVHTYSLIHDDLPAMDDDDLRRGRPSCHVAFDEATAILAGDALQSLAFEVLADPATHESAAVRAALVAALARAIGAGGMVGGQMIDLLAERSRPDAALIERLERLKTGALIAASCAMGAGLGHAGEDDRRALHQFGLTLGLAFQLVDDLLDVEGDSTHLGKTAGKDAAAGKATFVSLLGVDGARDKAAALTAEATASLDRFGPAAGRLRAVTRFVLERQA